MIKLNIDIPTIDNSELIEQLKKDPIIIDLFTRKQFNAELLYKFPIKFDRYRQNILKCKNCKGLANCKQNIKGKVIDLEYDMMIMEVFTNCKYQRNYDKKTAHLSKYYVCDLPENFKSIEFKNIELDKQSVHYIELLSKIKKMCQNDQGVYLYGTMGSGKSYLAACACNYHAIKGKKVAYVHVPSFSSSIKSMITTNEYDSLVSKLKRADFVVFDDIGAEKESVWFRDDILMPILNYRMANDLCTWFTSNENYESLRNHYLVNNSDDIKADRLMERIKCLTTIFELSEADRRNVNG